MMVEEEIDIQLEAGTTVGHIEGIGWDFQIVRIACQKDFGPIVFVQDEMDNNYLNLKGYYYYFTDNYLSLYFFLLSILNLYFYIRRYFVSF